jgi:hypothetical protein
MSRFDGRAEGAAVGRRDGGKKDDISPAEVRALKRALGTQHRKLEDDLSSVDVLLHTNPADENSPVEQGPPLPGSFTFDRAVEFIGRVADDIRQIRKAVTGVKMDPNHKQDLLEGLYNLAKAWDERAYAFATPEPASSAAKYRTAHEFERDAAPGLRVLNLYFPDAAEVEAES